MAWLLNELQTWSKMLEISVFPSVLSPLLPSFVNFYQIHKVRFGLEFICNQEALYRHQYCSYNTAFTIKYSDTENTGCQYPCKCFPFSFSFFPLAIKS